MKRISVVLSFLLLSFSSASSFASCDLNYTRTACPGKESTSFKKCDGKASCMKSVAADSLETCRRKAVDACANDRLDITKSKVISASMDGKPVLNKAGGTDLCQDYSERKSEFDKCGL